LPTLGLPTTAMAKDLLALGIVFSTVFMNASRVKLYECRFGFSE